MNTNAKATYGAGVCFLLLAVVTGAELAWRLFFMGILLVILLQLLQGYWSRSLSCSVELRTQGAPYLGAFEITYVFANNGLLPIPGCQLSIHLEKELGSYAFPPEVMDFAISEIKTLRKECRCPRRGVYSVGGATVTLTDPLGLRHRAVRFDRQVTVEVFPNPYPVEAVLVSGGGEGGALRGAWQADQDYTSLSRIRPALPQEPSRHIHWKASARTEILQVCEYETRRRRGITVFLESSTEKYADDIDGRLEDRCVDVAAGLALHWLKKGYEVELISGAGRELRLKGAQAQNQALRGLMAFRPDGHAALNQALPRLRSRDRLGTVLLIVTPSLTEADKTALSTRVTGRIAVYHIGSGDSEAVSDIPVVRIPVTPVEAL